MLGMWIALNSLAQRGFFKWLDTTALVSAVQLLPSHSVSDSHVTLETYNSVKYSMYLSLHYFATFLIKCNFD